MSLSLQNSIYSSQDLKEVILEVRKYSKWFSQTAVKIRLSGDNSHELPAISEAATKIINEWAKDNPISQKGLDKLIVALEDFEAAAPRITITLAAPSPNSLKQTLIAWCRENIDQNALVDFKFNSTILGGMVINYGSHIFDWSFRRQILASREKFPEVLRRV